MEWVVFIVIARDETSILIAVHFSMKNIYQLCDQGQATSASANNGLCLLTFAWRWLRIVMTLSAGVPSPGRFKNSVRQYLISNIRKTSLLLFLFECRVYVPVRMIWAPSESTNLKTSVGRAHLEWKPMPTCTLYWRAIPKIPPLHMIDKAARNVSYEKCVFALNCIDIMTIPRQDFIRDKFINLLFLIMNTL